MEAFQFNGVGGVRAGLEGAPILLVGGPPFGAGQFAQVQKRLGARASVALELIPGDGGLVQRLERAVAAVAPGLVFAHGFAVPVALAATLPAELPLVVSNGPVSRVPAPVRWAGRVPWTPGLLRRWLESSAGLRRAVVNPYVMDHDTIVALAGPLIDEPTTRREMMSWLRETEALLAAAHPRRGTTALWGDEDRLFPWSEAQALRKLDPFVRLVPVPGGRWLHPVERPWETADFLAGLAPAT